MPEKTVVPATASHTRKSILTRLENLADELGHEIPVSRLRHEQITREHLEVMLILLKGDFNDDREDNSNDRISGKPETGKRPIQPSDNNIRGRDTATDYSKTGTGD